jgi:hypothetical protein
MIKPTNGKLLERAPESQEMIPYIKKRSTVIKMCLQQGTESPHRYLMGRLPLHGFYL